MDDQQLLRYNRQILLPEIDIHGQQSLLASHVMIVGLGGLGSPAAMYLASSGVGKLSLLDFDTVELSNLQRQIIHDSNKLGRAKVDSAKEHLLAINDNIEIATYNNKMTKDELSPLLAKVDVLLDCSDNFDTRYALNELAVRHALPLVSGAVIGFEGHLCTFDFRRKGEACYRCLYPDDFNDTGTCAENGVLGPVAGVIGAMQAVETIKLLLNIGEQPSGQLHIYRALPSKWHTLQFRRLSDCPLCRNTGEQHDL